MMRPLSLRRVPQRLQDGPQDGPHVFWAHCSSRGAGYDPRYHLQAHAAHILQVFLIPVALLVWAVGAACVIAVVDHIKADASIRHIFRQTNVPKGARTDLCSKWRQSVTFG